MVSHNKVLKGYWIDYHVLEAFEKFVPSGERSDTLNELLKDYLTKMNRLNPSKTSLLAEKELIAQKAMEEFEALKAEHEREERRKAKLAEESRVEIARKDFFSELNDSTKEQSRLEVLMEMGLDPLESVPKEKQVEFVQKHKERHKELLSKRLNQNDVKGV